MTTRMTHAMEHRTKRRSSDERQYHVYYAVGFVLFLPFVVASRILPRPGYRTISSGAGDRLSVFEQTRDQVNNVLAFVFMA